MCFIHVPCVWVSVYLMASLELFHVLLDFLAEGETMIFEAPTEKRTSGQACPRGWRPGFFWWKTSEKWGVEGNRKNREKPHPSPW